MLSPVFFCIQRNWTIKKVDELREVREQAFFARLFIGLAIFFARVDMWIIAF